MLTDAERRVLTLHCFDHAVASCDDCFRNYRFTDLGVDVIGRRYYFCPSCRLDLTDDLRLHILGCRAITAAVEETIERSQLLMKESDRLATASELLAAESRELAKRVLEMKRDSCHVPAAGAVVQQLVEILLAQRRRICVRCLAHHAHLLPGTVMEGIEAISSHIRVSAKPGPCPECRRQDLLLSFGDGRTAAN